MYIDFAPDRTLAGPSPTAPQARAESRRPPTTAELARAIVALTRGDLVVIVDGDALHGRGRGLVAALADSTTPDQVNAMSRHARGLVGFAIDRTGAQRLGLRTMGLGRAPATDVEHLASVEAFDCVGTGISTADRAHTLNVAGRPDARAEHLRMPGHVVPMLVSDERGAGAHAVALRLAQWARPGALVAVCEMLDDCGDVAAREQCIATARQLGAFALVA
jgi:3,4-dihydroxy-2-butanone 4-phosphate synthase